MRKFLLLLLVLILSSAYYFRDFWLDDSRIVSPISKEGRIKSTYLNQYRFEDLRNREYPGSEIKIVKKIKEEQGYISYIFSYKSEGKNITGQLNLPNKADLLEKLPVIVMLRGYADDEIYFTGLGTRKAAGVFAENGFITLAPDFLGFGGSDSASSDILEARFERPIEILNLLASIKNLSQADPEKVFLWGHSNGGQIAISVLEILPKEKQIPTSLWAPVTIGFPQSVLSYMGELDDQGLKVKKAIDDFLLDYDPKNYSINYYYEDLDVPILLHQGSADPLVKPEWSDTFVTQLKEFGKEITYYRYSRNDHNLKQSWDLVVQRDLDFFRKHLK